MLESKYRKIKTGPASQIIWEILVYSRLLEKQPVLCNYSFPWGHIFQIQDVLLGNRLGIRLPWIRQEESYWKLVCLEEVWDFYKHQLRQIKAVDPIPPKLATRHFFRMKSSHGLNSARVIYYPTGTKSAV